MGEVLQVARFLARILDPDRAAVEQGEDDLHPLAVRLGNAKGGDALAVLGKAGSRQVEQEFAAERAGGATDRFGEAALFVHRETVERQFQFHQFEGRDRVVGRMKAVE